jgi:hypothetical protein
MAYYIHHALVYKGRINNFHSEVIRYHIVHIRLHFAKKTYDKVGRLSGE